MSRGVRGTHMGRQREALPVALLDRLLAEYEEMPGLSLTAPQVARLLGVDRDVAANLLLALLAVGHLRCTHDGLFRAAASAA